MAKKFNKPNVEIAPELQFMSKETIEAVEGKQAAAPTPRGTEKAPEGYKLNPLYVETKSKRVQLLVQPSLLEKLRARAKAEGESVNNLVHSILEEALKEE